MASVKHSTSHRRGNSALPSGMRSRPQHIKQREDTLQTYAFARVGAPYPITERELHVLQDKPILKRHHRDWRPPPIPINLKAAHRQLEDFAHSGETQRQSEARLRLWKAYILPSDRRTPDLFIKIFNDIDELLFDGLLRNRVRIR